MNASNRTPLIIIGILVIVLIIGGIAWFFLGKSTSAGKNPTASSTTALPSSSPASSIADTGAPATHYTDSGRYYDIDLQYPSATPLASTASSDANTAAVQILKDFATKSAASFVSENNLTSITAADAKEQGLDQGRKYAFSDSYQFYSSPNTVSYLFTIYSDTLGAHPNSYYQTFTFDAKTGKQLALSDLFTPGSSYLSTLSALASANLTQQLAGNSDQDFIKEGTAPTADNFQNFVLDGTNLTIFFPPYQVAAYAAGPQTVKIPLSQLSSILQSQYK